MEQQLWFNRQLRICQTVLREPDIERYDAKAVVEYLESIEANCFVINAGGIIDLFQNPLDLKNHNRLLGERDILGEISELCHARGIRVIARVDFRGVERHRYEQRPDVFALDENGDPHTFRYKGKALPEPLYMPCYLSWYRNEHAFEFGRYLLSNYKIDGIWENAPMQYGACYCKSCRSAYLRDTGKELPRGGDYEDIKYDEYRTWKAGNLEKHLINFQREIKAFGEDKIFCAEILGLFYDYYLNASQDIYQIRDSMDFLVTPMFVSNHEPLSAPSMLGKFMKSLAPKKTPVMLFGHLGTDNELRYVSNSPAELRIWMWQAISTGASLWDCTFNGMHPGVTYDRRNESAVGDVFRLIKRHDDKLHNQTSMCTTSIFYSKRTNFFRGDDGGRAKDHYLSHLLGLEQCLQDRHIQYDFVLDVDLTPESLEGKTLLIIPNGELLSEHHAEVVRSFVKDGGRVLATGRTSLRTETGEARDDFELNDVFGCSYTGLSIDVSNWGYQWVSEPNHPVLQGFERTNLTANWGECPLVKVEAGSNAKSLMTYLPPIFPQPPEKSWLRSMESPYTTAVENTFGRGRSIYFPGDIDRNIRRHGHLDFDTLLGNAVEYLLEGKNPVVTNAPPSVQISLTRTNSGNEKGFMLHLINVSSAPRRPIKNVLPVYDIAVELTLPAKTFHSFEVVAGEPADVEVSREAAPKANTLALNIKIEWLVDVISIYIAAD
ncbi:hypothetical protein F3J20_11990 [Paraburkholderia sp. Cy-641]|uniref:alpha-amylase family protein n=1 Tax=Paraburkholderia sp. Cy-641 TaxID=2608337 RepID=UPI00141F2FF9|nr:alpha-amylase family protein [Paraburkholderia sp. Cy-641]NIF78109.1 hypothetical protein [Paraburkholderia sp. Cy-641]